MNDAKLSSTSDTPAATRARRGAAAVIAQYIQDLSGAQASLASRAQSALATPVSPASSPCSA